MLIRNLRRFTVAEFSNEFPLCSELINTIPKQEIILIAALFHDIAKGRGGDHSALGAIDARAFCVKHDLSTYDTNLIVWIIENHLLMSSTAQKKDISDPDIVYEFAAHIGDINRLKYLYLLTVADMRATSDSVWNSWKDSLLKNLFQATQDVFRRGLENPALKSELAVENKRLVLNNLQQHYAAEKILEAWRSFSDDYFTRYSISEITWQTESIIKADNAASVFSFKHSSKHNVTSLFIHTKSFVGIFAVITSVLEFFKLGIIDARIIKSTNGKTLDTYHIINTSSKTIDDTLCTKIKETLHDCLMQKTRKEQTTTSTRLSRIAKQFQQPTTVSFSNEINENATVMTVKSSDQTGILSQLALILSEQKIIVTAAKIATYGEIIQDIFNITTEDGLKLPSNKQNALEKSILELLETNI